MATKAPFYLAGSTPLWGIKDALSVFPRIQGIGGCDIDGDGSGLNIAKDPTFQNATTYKPNLNSRLVRYFVVPKKLRLLASGIVIGCQGRVTLLATMKSLDFVVGDTGPDDKFGEMSIAGADAFGIDSDPNTGGTIEPIFLYQFWPGIPAVVDKVVYDLQAA